MFAAMAASRVLQASRMGSVVVMTGIPFFNRKVYALDDDECPPEPESKNIKVSDLPLYSDKDEDKCKFLDNEISSFHNRISEVRQSFSEYFATALETKNKVQSTYNEYATRLRCYVKFVQEDPSVLPRAAVITVAGLGGLVAGYRGGRIRKLFFATTGMTAAAALCYPKEAVEFSNTAYDFIVTEVVKAADGFAPTKKKKSESSAGDDDGECIPVTDSDQSNPEDKDLYTTRGK